MAKYIKGKLFGDKGIQLITWVRRNIKAVVLEDFDKILLRKRALIETVNDPLKNISEIEHTHHRSLLGFMVHDSSYVELRLK